MRINPRRFSTETYLSDDNGWWDELTLEEEGILFRAWRIATREHRGIDCRSGGKYIEHTTSTAQMVREWGLSIHAQAGAVTHDVVEDGRITVEEIACKFGPTHGPIISKMVYALTKDKSNPSDYFPKILRVTKELWETVVVKLADRIENLERPFGDDPAREIRFLRETVGPFHQMCLEAKPHIPDWFASKYDYLVNLAIRLALDRLSVIKS